MLRHSRLWGGKLFYFLQKYLISRCFYYSVKIPSFVLPWFILEEQCNHEANERNSQNPEGNYLPGVKSLLQCLPDLVGGGSGIFLAEWLSFLDETATPSIADV